MASSSSELTLDCKPYSYSILLKSFGDQTAAASADHHTQKLEDVLARLEDERLKVDAFKRELPLCMQLLSNAVEASRQQLQACKENENRGPSPVLEEFITLKNSSSENSDMSENMSDKSSWMTTAQLWSQPGNETKPQTSKTTTSYKESDVGFRNGGGGAFLPFSKERNSCRRSPTFRPLSDLAPASTDKVVMEDKKYSEINENGRDGNPTDEGPTNSSTTTTTNANQNHRKARRCWSPELHRRFVSALQILGGCHVATPKQIREMMKVDGLTNDEVKSHLQKYRLHTRRPSPSQQAIGASAPQLVVLGGIWVPQEYATAAAAAHGGTPTLFHHNHNHHPSSHAPPPHFCAASSLPQDFYTAAAPPAHHQLHHHTLHNHHQLQVYKATSQGQCSPESEIRGEGDRSESIEEDGKSESSSRKGESGGERKGLAALREDGEEESNGSEITLKF